MTIADRLQIIRTLALQVYDLCGEIERKKSNDYRRLLLLSDAVYFETLAAKLHLSAEGESNDQGSSAKSE